MKKNNKGFSLIEIMIGIVIVITASTIVLSVIISSFRISSKTTSTSIIRQNGNYALSQATRMLQYADKFNGAKVNSTSVPEQCPTTDKTYQQILITYNGVATTINCSATSGIEINGKSSIDTGPTGKISVTSCNFTCRQDPAEGPVIGINLDLTTKNETAADRKSSINFSTSVKIRNY